MRNKKLIVGGESVFSPSIIFKKHQGQFSNYGSSLPEYNRYFTFGGYYSFRAIIQNISFSKDDYVLLPSYLCPTMIWPFKEAGIKYDFYRIKEGLLPDIEDIATKTHSGLKLILFVDYFGYPYKDYLESLVDHLKKKNIYVLQDGVQSWLNNEDQIYGDFYVNSVRKYSPFEGSVILSKSKLMFNTKELPILRFVVRKRIGQIMRYYHINYGKFRSESFLKHINISHSCYHKKDIIRMPLLNKILLDKLDYNMIGKQRIKVFNYLRHTLEKESIVKIETDSVIPLMLPIYLENRDHKKAMLHKNDIHCPVHWQLPNEVDKKEHDYAWHISMHELSLPLNIPIYQKKSYKEILLRIL